MSNNNISDTHEWRNIEAFVEGDCIHRWGDDLPVLHTEQRGTLILLVYRETDGQEKELLAQIGKQYIARKRTVLEREEEEES